MAAIAPFRGIMYNPDKIKNLSSVVSLPYDKISDEKRCEYLERSKYNIARIIKPEPPSSDSPEDSKYEEVANYLAEWRQQDILIQDRTPGFYVYHQQYKVPGGGVRIRKGLVALLELREFGDGVFPHERTFSAPKEDRLKLLRASQANFGQIFFLYSDPEHRVTSLLEEVEGNIPYYSLELEDLDEQHRMWKIFDQTLIDKIRASFAPLEVYLADGHHRYETALAYYREKKEEGLSGTDLDPYRYRMVTLVDMESDGLTILPTHRGVKLSSPPESKEVRENLSSLFSLQSLEVKGEETEDLVKGAQKWLEEKEDSSFVLVEPDNQLWGMELEEGEQLQKYDLPDIFSKVDVAILHQVIFEKLLEIDVDGEDEGVTVGYIREMAEVIEKVQSGDFDFAFLMNPIPMSQFRKVTKAGYRLPQKSTDFYPKMLSGLVIYSMKD